MASNEIYRLQLNDDGSPDVPGGYIYLMPKSADPITVRFEIEGTSSICRHGSLWVNIPKEGAEYHRHKYREFKSVIPYSASHLDTNHPAGSSRTSIEPSTFQSPSTVLAHLLSIPPTHHFTIYPKPIRNPSNLRKPPSTTSMSRRASRWKVANCLWPRCRSSP